MYLITASGHLQTSDTWATLATAESLVLHGDPAIAYEKGFPGSVGSDGRFYCQFGLGSVLDLVPAALAGHWLALGVADPLQGKLRRGLPATLVNPIATALTAMLLALALVRLGLGERRAVGAAGVYALATFAWSSAHADLADPQVAAAVFLGFVLLLDATDDAYAYERPWPWFLAGAALGFAFLIKLTAALFWPACLWLAWPRLKQEPGAWLPLLMGPCTALTLFAMYNVWRFGSPLATGYAPQVQMTWISPWIGLYGLTLAIGKGLLFFAPPVALAAWGFPSVQEHHPRVSQAIAIAAVLNLGFFSIQQNFGGDWAYGPRYLLPLLPFLMVWVAPALGPAEDSAAPRAVRVALVTLGVWVALLGVLIDHTGFARWMSAQKSSLGEFLGEPDRVYIPLHEHYFNPDLSPIRGHAYLLWGTLAHMRGEPVPPLKLFTSLQETSSRESHRLTRSLELPFDDAAGGLDLWWVLWMPLLAPAGRLAALVCVLLLALVALHGRGAARAALGVAKPPVRS